MSELDSLQKAQLDHLQKENSTLKSNIHSYSGQMLAQKQCLEEYLQANINLKAAIILNDVEMKNLNAQLTSSIERIQVLEKEKAELQLSKEEVTKERDELLSNTNSELRAVNE